MSAPDENGWMPIETARKASMPFEEVLISGRYPNGIAYVEASFWHPKGHWNGRKIDPPTHWQPLPKPPANPHEGG